MRFTSHKLAPTVMRRSHVQAYVIPKHVACPIGVRAAGLTGQRRVAFAGNLAVSMNDAPADTHGHRLAKVLTTDDNDLDLQFRTNPRAAPPAVALYGRRAVIGVLLEDVRYQENHERTKKPLVTVQAEGVANVRLHPDLLQPDNAARQQLIYGRPMYAVSTNQGHIVATLTPPAIYNTANNPANIDDNLADTGCNPSFGFVYEYDGGPFARIAMYTFTLNMWSARLFHNVNRQQYGYPPAAGEEDVNAPPGLRMPETPWLLGGSFVDEAAPAAAPAQANAAFGRARRVVATAMVGYQKAAGLEEINLGPHGKINGNAEELAASHALDGVGIDADGALHLPAGSAAHALLTPSRKRKENENGPFKSFNKAKRTALNEKVLAVSLDNTQALSSDDFSEFITQRGGV